MRMTLPATLTRLAGAAVLLALSACGGSSSGNTPSPTSTASLSEPAQLGALIFSDQSLSASGRQSCASCHNPALSWQDGLPRGVGANMEPMAVRTPTLLNVAWTPKLGWDGHFRDLESVAFGPITNPGIMNMPEKELIARLSAIPGYVKAFHTAFGDTGVSKHNIELALATFERSIVAGEAPFDRWINGDKTAISAAAKRGFDLFNGKAHCSACHSGWSFTDSSFHDVGVATGKDIGRGRLCPTSESLRYAFKTPTLRDVDRRAPYMHDGSVATLEKVIDLYNRGGIDRPSRAEDVRPLGLTAQNKADLIAFLHTLTGTPVTVALTALPR